MNEVSFMYLNSTLDNYFEKMFRDFFRSLNVCFDNLNLLKDDLEESFKEKMQIIVIKDYEPIGFIALKVDEDTDKWNIKPGAGEICAIYVIPEKRSKKYSKMLLEEAYRVFTKMGINEVYLSTDEPSFFLKNGFVLDDNCALNELNILKKLVKNTNE